MDVSGIPTLTKKLDYLIYISKKAKDKTWVTERIRKFKNIKHNNLIVFKPIRGTWHVGIVWGVRNGILRYVDMNGKTSLGVKEMSFKSKRIYKVYKIGFDFFAGDFLNRKRR